MRAFSLYLAALVIVSAATLSWNAWANVATLNFAVMRNGEQIGTSTVRLHRQGQQTIAEVVTHVQVKVFGITVYRFEQTETEHWVDGKLVAMNSRTNDNGALHKVSARSRGNALAIEADGKTSEVDGAVIPASLWNASLVQKTMALDLQDGTLIPVSVIDHGPEQLILQGRPTNARHYSINTTFAQDVWYDDQQQLVKVELRGSDGSRIHYQPG